MSSWEPDCFGCGWPTVFSDQIAGGKASDGAPARNSLLRVMGSLMALGMFLKRHVDEETAGFVADISRKHRRSATRVTATDDYEVQPVRGKLGQFSGVMNRLPTDVLEIVEERETQLSPKQFVNAFRLCGRAEIPR